MKGVLNPEALTPLTSVSAWLVHAEDAREAVAGKRETLGESDFLLALTERNVIEQLRNLQTHPAVAARLVKKDLKLHGWVYDIAKGTVTKYSPRNERFIRIRSVKPQKAKR
jgi:carbonic anhydrase